MKNFKTAALTGALALAGLPALAATYDIDPAHSTIGFKIRHMMVSKVAGTFGKYTGTFDYDPKDPKAWAAKAAIETASVDTRNEKRDGHLKSPDFFDVEKFPSMEFVSTGIKGWKGGKGKLMGKLTLHGVTKDVALDLELVGAAKDPGGNERAGFTATTTINRKDYGVSWNKAMEAGGVMLSEEVWISIEVEGVKKKS